MQKENWFSKDGDNVSGHSQLIARALYLEKEGDNLSPAIIKYELQVINQLSSFIPNKESREIYKNSISQKLGGLIKKIK